MKSKSHRPKAVRKSIAGRFDELPTRKFLERVLLAQFGKPLSPGERLPFCEVGRVLESWRRQVEKWKLAGKPGQPTLKMDASLLLQKMHDLDDRFFMDVAKAIRYFKHRGHLDAEDEPRFKLCSDDRIYREPLLTIKQIADREGYRGNMEHYAKVLRRMKIPHVTQRGCRK